MLKICIYVSYVLSIKSNLTSTLASTVVQLMYEQVSVGPLQAEPTARLYMYSRSTTIF
jgi:hypothetical protein